MDAFSKVRDQIETIIRTILGSPAPELAGSVVMVIEECGPGRVTVKGMEPAKGKPTVVLKTVTCAEVDELLALNQSLQQLAGASFG